MSTEKKKKPVIYVDIDETICNTPEDRDYTKSTIIQENLDKVNRLYEEGNHIVYWTARGSRSGIDWYDFTLEQLTGWGAKYHELRCDKPYYDTFIEDRSIRIEELG